MRLLRSAGELLRQLMGGRNGQRRRTRASTAERECRLGLSIRGECAGGNQRLVLCRLCAAILCKRNPPPTFRGGCVNRCPTFDVIRSNRTKLFPPGGIRRGTGESLE